MAVRVPASGRAARASVLTGSDVATRYDELAVRCEATVLVAAIHESL
ncbi:hypothetical protein HHL19_17920 [Streptomyces sp. R302]|nr:MULTISPECIES: hypothetical protein [unclassified Streptomyces]NML52561.1 hypothetical protein [Streptomyces sp. R301]NML80510.1 hypothetical protein [Streptomyces sp. R302]